MKKNIEESLEKAKSLQGEESREWPDPKNLAPVGQTLELDMTSINWYRNQEEMLALFTVIVKSPDWEVVDPKNSSYRGASVDQRILLRERVKCKSGDLESVSGRAILGGVDGAISKEALTSFGWAVVEPNSDIHKVMDTVCGIAYRREQDAVKHKPKNLGADQAENWQ